MKQDIPYNLRDCRFFGSQEARTRRSTNPASQRAMDGIQPTNTSCSSLGHRSSRNCFDVCYRRSPYTTDSKTRRYFLSLTRNLRFHSFVRTNFFELMARNLAKLSTASFILNSALNSGGERRNETITTSHCHGRCDKLSRQRLHE